MGPLSLPKTLLMVMNGPTFSLERYRLVARGEMTSGGGVYLPPSAYGGQLQYLLLQDRPAACGPFSNLAVLFRTHMLPHGRVYYCGTLLPSGDLPSVAESGDATGPVAPFSLAELLVLPKFQKD